MTRPQGIFSALGVSLVYCIISIILYRVRLTGHLVIAKSDFVMFLLPLILLTVGHFLIFWHILPLGRTIVWRLVTTALCVSVSSGLSFFGVLFLLFNRYGT